jgi:hypothetical protein
MQESHEIKRPCSETEAHASALPPNAGISRTDSVQARPLALTRIAAPETQKSKAVERKVISFGMPSSVAGKRLGAAKALA